MTANGKLPLPPHDEDDDNQIFSIDMFLYSYMTGRNLTISNGTATAGNASLGEIMAQEPGSTVKHINWVWPDCLVGDGKPEGDSDRGVYNVSNTYFFTLSYLIRICSDDIPRFPSGKTLGSTAMTTTPSSTSQSMSPTRFLRMMIGRLVMSYRMIFSRPKKSTQRQLIKWAFCLRQVTRPSLKPVVRLRRDLSWIRK